MNITHTIRLVTSAAAAITEVRKYQDAITGAAQTVGRHANTLSGDRLLKSANEWTAAVAKLGDATEGLATTEQLMVGVSRMTAADKAKLNRILEEAIEKYRVLGKEAPTAMREVHAALQPVPSTLERLAERSSAWGESLSAAGKMILPVSATVGSFGAIAIKAAMDYEASLATIQGLTGETGRGLEALGESYRATYRLVPQSAEEVATALGIVRRDLGATGGELEGLTKRFLDYARVSKQEVGESTRTVTQLMKALELDAQTVPLVLDQIVFTAQKTGAGIGDLTGALISGGTMFREFGWSTEGAMALLGQFTMVGAKPIEVVQGLRQALVSMAREGVTDTAAEMSKWIARIQAAETATEGVALAAKVFGSQVAEQLTQEIRGGTFNVAAFEAAIRGAGGTLDTVADSSMTTKQRLAQLKNEVLDAAVPIGVTLLEAFRSLLPHISTAAGWVRQAAEWFSDLPGPVKAVAVVLGALVTAAGPLLMFLGSLASSVSTLLPLLPKIGTVLTALTGPIGWTIAAVAGLIAIWVAFGDDISRVVQQVWTAVKEWLWDKFEPIITPIMGVLRALWQAWEAYRELQVAVLVAIVSAVADMVQAVGGWLWDKLGPIIKAVVAVFVWMRDGIVTVVAAVYGAVKEWLLDKFTWIVDGIRGVAEGATNIFRRLKTLVVGETADVAAAAAAQVEVAATAVTNAATSTAAAQVQIQSTTTAAALAADDYAAQLATVRRELAALSPATIAQFKAAEELGEKTETLAKILGGSEAHVRLLKEQLKASADAAKAAGRDKAKLTEDVKGLETRLQHLRAAGLSSSDILDRLGKDALKTADRAMELGLRFRDVSSTLDQLGRDYMIVTALQQFNAQVAKDATAIIEEQSKAIRATATARWKAEQDRLSQARQVVSEVLALGRTELEEKLHQAAAWRDGSLKHLEALRTAEPKIHAFISERIAEEYARRVADAKASAAAQVGAMTQALNSAPDVLIKALMGGGDPVKAISAHFGQALFSGEKGLGGLLQSGISKLGTKIGGDFGANLAGTLSNALPGIGAAVGPVLASLGGKLLGSLFGKSAGRKELEEFNAKIAETRTGLLETYGSLEQIGRLDRALGTGVAAGWAHQGKAGYEAFTKSAEQLQARLAAVKAELADVAESGGVASAQLIAYRDAMLSDDADVQAFVLGQVNAAAGHVRSYLESSRLMTQEGASAMSSIVLAAWDGTAQGLRALQPAIQQLQVRLTESGFAGGEAFGRLQTLAGIVTSDVSGPMVTAINTATSALTAMYNAGYLTQDVFGGLVAEVMAQRDALLATGATSEHVNAVMQQDLQRIWQLVQDGKYAIDEKTQALLDEAEAAGQVGDQFRTSEDRMVRALERLATMFETVFADKLPAHAAAGARAAEQALRGIPSDLDVRIHPRMQDRDTGDQADIPGFRTGTMGRYLDFGAGTTVQLHGRERVVTEAEGRAEARQQALSTAALEAELRALRADLPRAIGVAVQDAMALAPRGRR